jgi:hypothetical protein
MMFAEMLARAVGAVVVAILAALILRALSG